jgi:transcriptional regulator with XRE-family HTH domain
MAASRPLTRQEQLAKLVRDCRYRLNPGQFPSLDGDTGGPRKRQRRAKRVTIEQIAGQSGYSEGWHSKLERGRDEGYSDDFLNTVATILQMTSDERSMLFSLAPRRRGTEAPEEELRESRVIQWALDEITCPAFIIDSAWGVLSFNKPTAEWFPWVHGDRPNFMRWAFTTAEARIVLHNWDTEWGPQLWAEMQYTLARQPENAKLTALIGEILEDSHAARMINERPLDYVNPDGKRRRVKLPVFNNRIHVVEQVVFTPGRAPGSRVMMIVPLDDTQH